MKDQLPIVLRNKSTSAENKTLFHCGLGHEVCRQQWLPCAAHSKSLLHHWVITRGDSGHMGHVVADVWTLFAGSTLIRPGRSAWWNAEGGCPCHAGRQRWSPKRFHGLVLNRFSASSLDSQDGQDLFPKVHLATSTITNADVTVWNLKKGLEFDYEASSRDSGWKILS